MNPEHYRVRVERHRLVLAVVGATKLAEMAQSLGRVGAIQVGPGAWLCDAAVPVDHLAQTVGELAKDEVVYLAANGTDRMDVGFLVAPNTEGGIIVGSAA